ncbi:MAG: hypothetical protein LIP11_14790 [Clostridiales bacterium]|nr:hypothetical protein [Clostridiales bacterium]
MGVKKADVTDTDEFFGRLVCMFSEIDPSFLEDEIPEQDLEPIPVASTGWNPERGTEPRTHTNWKTVVAVSGFAAACSAAVAGIAVFVCMRRFAAFDGVRRA